MKVLVLGLTPSKLGGKSPTLRNLYKWLDELKLQHVSFTNIYPHPDCGYDVDHIMDICGSYDKILSLGKEVSTFLDLMGVPHFKLPHPSGRNRQLNDRKFMKDQLTKCSNYVWGNQ